MTIKRILVFVTLLAAFFMYGCDNPTLRDKIEKKEKQLTQSAAEEGQDEVVESLLEDYMAFVEQNPGDSLTPLYRFRSADIMMNRNMPVKALEQLDIILNRHPDFSKGADALFLKGYVLENSLGELGRAKEVYHRFLEKYPGHAFADDVEVSLKHLGRSPEELVRMFEKEADDQPQPENSSER